MSEYRILVYDCASAVVGAVLPGKQPSRIRQMADTSDSNTAQIIRAGTRLYVIVSDRSIRSAGRVVDMESPFSKFNRLDNALSIKMTSFKALEAFGLAQSTAKW